MTLPEGIISYHSERRGSRMIPLRSYGNPPPEAKFKGLDYIDFKLNNVSNFVIDFYVMNNKRYILQYVVPASGTTYHCKVYRVPKNINSTRHAIGVCI